MRVLYIEPYERGSHAAFTRTLTAGVRAEWTVLTLPGRHWKWRMRGAAAWFATRHREELAASYDVLFASAMLPLAELLGLCPKLEVRSRVLYFHENQLAYPWREEFRGERDNHFGFTQLVSALAADRVVFNSEYNRSSFLTAAEDLLRRLPDRAPTEWVSAVRERSEVMPLPLSLPEISEADLVDAPPSERRGGPLIVWNHRWEHDKNPQAFFAALFDLKERGIPFRAAVCGERFGAVPEVFGEAQRRLGDHLEVFGPLESRAEYEALLRRAQVVVSTARQEFFGASVVEAVHAGARPLVPDRLVYPEWFPEEYRFSDDADLAPALGTLIEDWCAGRCDLRRDRRHLTNRFSASEMLPRYRDLLENCGRS